MKLNSKFFKEKHVKAMSLACGAEGVLTLIRLLNEMFESPQGYWKTWSRVDKAAFAEECRITIESMDRIIAAMCEYGIVDSSTLERYGVLTSAYIQTEFIKQRGAAHARKKLWDKYVLIESSALEAIGIQKPQPQSADTTEDEYEPEYEPGYDYEEEYEEENQLRITLPDGNVAYRLIKRRDGSIVNPHTERDEWELVSNNRPQNYLICDRLVV